MFKFTAYEEELDNKRYYSIYYTCEREGLFDYVLRFSFSDAKKFVYNLGGKKFNLIRLNGKEKMIRFGDI